MTGFRNPSRDEIHAFLRKIRTIAVIGLSADPARPSHEVAHALQGFGYTVIPVNPSIDSVLGLRCWPSIQAAVEAGNGPIDLVDVFRLPRHVPQIVDDCIQLHLPALWLQDGVIDEPSAMRARAAGMFTVMDRCIYRDRAALAGAGPLGYA